MVLQEQLLLNKQQYKKFLKLLIKWKYKKYGMTAAIIIIMWTNYSSG